MDEVVFGRYRLIEAIGEGGMGKVYKAHDTVIDRYVAVKVLSTELVTEPGFRERFRREAHTAARLTEPHIIPIHDTGEVDGRLYLVMPIINGTDVGTLLKREGPLNPERAVLVVEQLAAALDAAHAAGLVHRDIKPSNALMTKGDFTYLIDFGIAHDAGATKVTKTGTIIGTLAYMAPERFTTGVADARADVYSLTCLLYEGLTGAQPYPGDSAEQQITAHLTHDPPKPSTFNSAIPAAFDYVISRGMAKKPTDRFPSAGELARAARAAAASSQAPTAFASVHAKPARASRRAWIGLGSVAAIMLLIGVVTLAWRPWQQARQQPSTLSASPTTAPMSLTGKWSGSVSGAQSGFDVVADIVDDAQLTGTVSYPQLYCGGIWTQHGSAGNGVRLVTETITHGNCVNSDVTLTPQNDGTLSFTSTYYAASKQRDITIYATMRRSAR